ncbi:MAG: coiled-coil domain-containing protein, partial [Gammaproteobacteria bacterium]
MKRGWENLLHGVVAGLVLPAVASVYPQTAAAQDRMGEVQNRMQELQDEVRALQQELQQMKADDDAKHKQLEDRVTTAEAAPAAKRAHKNLVFFRGGYTAYPNEGRGFESFTDTHRNIIGLGSENDGNDNGWYVGAAIEHSLTDDLWGLWPSTEALGEISLEWKRFGTENATVVVPSAECALLLDDGVQGALGSAGLGVLGGDGDLSNGFCGVTGDINITMFTVSAAPKIKFMQGS